MQVLKGALGIAWVAVALIGASVPPARAVDTDTYVVIIDVAGKPMPANEWRSLDENRIVELCRDQDGCTFQMKIDGPAGRSARRRRCICP